MMCNYTLPNTTLSNKENSILNRKKIFRRLIEAQQKNSIDFKEIIFDESFDLYTIKKTETKSKLKNLLNWLEIKEPIPTTKTHSQTSTPLLAKFIVVNKRIHFNKAIFKTEIDFSHTQFNLTANFQAARFYNNAFFDETKFSMDANFGGTEFFGLAYFKNTIFEKKADFNGVSFSGSAYFRKAHFHKNANFYANIFQKDANFSQSFFQGKINFSFAIFQDLFLLHRINMNHDTYLILDHASIKEGYFKSIPNIDGKHIQNKETARFFKHNAIYNNDMINTLNYKALEMHLYRQELTNRKNIKWYQRSDEKILLLLNFISNKYGKSWVTGVVFTIITSVIFTTIIMLFGVMPKTNTYQEWIEGFIGIINIFSDKFTEDHTLNTIGLILTFTSKIFVSYGIYQTISAFRKYGK